MKIVVKVTDMNNKNITIISDIENQGVDELTLDQNEAQLVNANLARVMFSAIMLSEIRRVKLAEAN